MSLEKENKNRYKVVLSREDWKKILLEINDYVIGVIFFIVFLGAVILYVLFKISYSKIYIFFAFLKWFFLYGLMFLFAGLILFLFLKSFTTVLKPFHFRGMVIDVVERKILLKNKTLYFKKTDRIVFYLERKREKSKISPTHNKKKNEGKDKSASDWVYYVKKKAFHKSNNQKLSNQAFLDNSFEEFIISPVEIKYLKDFSLVLGTEGLLGAWRRIAELLGVGFEENIEFEEKVMLQPKGNAFSLENNTDSGFIGEHSFLDEKGNDKEKMRDFLNLLKGKIEKKYPSGDTSWDSTGFEEFVLFKEELMGVRMFSTGFELRFWSGASEFPGKEPVINKKFVFNQLIDVLVSAMVIFVTIFFLASQIEEIILKMVVSLSSLFLFFYIVAFDLGNSIKDTRSKEFLFRTTYVIETFSLFMFGIFVIVLGLFANTPDFKISFISVVGFLICVFIFFSTLSAPLESSCRWNLTINRYLSRFVFSFEDKVLEGEYGFCVSRTHWQASVSKIQSLGLLKIGRSLFGSGDFLLTIKIDEDYVLLPLPKLEEDKIHELLFFLQQVFNTLLAAFYSVNNMGRRK